LRPSRIRRPSLRRALLAATFALLVAASPAFAGAGPVEAHSPNAEDIRTAYWVMLVVIAILAVAALGGLVAALRRFRERPGSEPKRVVAGRGAITRVAVPLGAVAIGIFVFGIVMTEKTTSVEPSGPDGLQAQATRLAQVGVEALPEGDAPPLQINVIGQQWLWRFEYPQASEREDINTVFTYNELVVPVDTAVILNIGSTDVMHRWFVPALGGQVMAVPGEINTTWFKADAEGVYPGQATQFNGTSYPAMRAWVRVLSATDYEAWLEQQTADIKEAQAAVQAAVAAGDTPEAETSEEGE
jgi:cytochrome c oxidase subunit 2